MNTYPPLNSVYINVKPTGSLHRTRLGIPFEAQLEILKHPEKTFPNVESIVYFARDLNYFESGNYDDKTRVRFNEKKNPIVLSALHNRQAHFAQ